MTHGQYVQCPTLHRKPLSRLVRLVLFSSSQTERCLRVVPCSGVNPKSQQFESICRQCGPRHFQTSPCAEALEKYSSRAGVIISCEQGLHDERNDSTVQYPFSSSQLSRDGHPKHSGLFQNFHLYISIFCWYIHRWTYIPPQFESFQNIPHPRKNSNAYAVELSVW